MPNAAFVVQKLQIEPTSVKAVETEYMEKVNRTRLSLVLVYRAT